MQEIEFEVPPTCDLGIAAELIERVCRSFNLDVTMKGSLATFPGCTHWHFKRSKEKGTLELTLFVPKQRIWAQIQSGRSAPWIDSTLPKVQHEIEMELKRRAATSTSRAAAAGRKANGQRRTLR